MKNRYTQQKRKIRGRPKENLSSTKVSQEKKQKKTEKNNKNWQTIPEKATRRQKKDRWEELEQEGTSRELELRRL